MRYRNRLRCYSDQRHIDKRWVSLRGRAVDEIESLSHDLDSIIGVQAVLQRIRVTLVESGQSGEAMAWLDEQIESVVRDIQRLSDAMEHRSS